MSERATRTWTCDQCGSQAAGVSGVSAWYSLCVAGPGLASEMRQHFCAAACLNAWWRSSAQGNLVEDAGAPRRGGAAGGIA